MRKILVGQSILIVALALCGAITLSLADQVVYFSNGKGMMVKKVIDEGDGITILELEGGGRIGVPTAQIVKIEEYAVSKPSGRGAAPRAPNSNAQAARSKPAVQQAAPPPPAAVVTQQNDGGSEQGVVAVDRRAL